MMETQIGGLHLQAYTKPLLVFDPKYTIPSEIVDDVICRFLLNIPKEEKFDSIRVCFQIELAHWFFQDYYCGEGSEFAASLQHLHGIPYNQFAYIMFQKTPHLRPRLPEIDKHLAAFREYKMRVPTYGAILTNKTLTKVVLVQGFRNQWGFPKGKVNEEEDPVACATREVFEETGYDISQLVNENNFIETKTFDRHDRLYIVHGVDTDYPFHPQTNYEIKNIKWFNIDELPEHKRDTNPLIAKCGVAVSSFFTVYPYIKRLRVWIADKLEGKNKIKNFRVRHNSESIDNQTQTPGTQRSGKGTPSSQPQFQKAYQHPAHFPQQNMSGREPAGWTLFQGTALEQKQLAIASNSIQELLLGQGQLQLAHQQRYAVGGSEISGSGNAGKSTGKAVRRRLFSEENSPLSVSKQISEAVVSIPDDPLPKQKSGKPDNRNVCTVRDVLLTAPSWTNFTFDREKIYRSFFTPSV